MIPILEFGAIRVFCYDFDKTPIRGIRWDTKEEEENSYRLLPRTDHTKPIYNFNYKSETETQYTSYNVGK